MNYLSIRAKKLFQDSLKITVRGGKGGHGLPQYGGIGGKGGDVYFQGSSQVKSLKGLRKMKNFVAQDGQPAKRTRLVGEAGRDLVIKIPVGVTIEDSQRQILGDIDKPREKVIVAMGGRGGDKFNDNQGFVGQTRLIRLDYKMISDIALVGFPNAGKSTLLSKISNAKPKIANYPFTTLRPNLGVIEYDDIRQITVADLPGLVEGAHKNLGLGHEFLKHMVRTKLLLFLIDINNIDLGPAYSRRSPIEVISILNKEIELFDDTILDKPAILAVNKMDTLPDSEERYEKLMNDITNFDNVSLEEALKPKRLISFDKILSLSAEKSTNIGLLKKVCRDTLDKYAEKERLTYGELQVSENNRLIG